MRTRSTSIPWMYLLALVLMLHAPAVDAQDTFAPQAQVQLLWPDADHVRPPGKYNLKGSYTLLDPTINFASAGFIINNTPYDAGGYVDNTFALKPSFRPGEYLIAAFILTDDGQMLPGEAHTLVISADAPIAEVPAPAAPPATRPTQPTAPRAPAAQPGADLRDLKVSVEFDAPIDGQAWSGAMSFPPYEPDLRLQPQVNWTGNRFEAFVQYTKPSAEIWDASRNTIAKTKWDIRYRVYGSLAADHQSLESVTFEYQAQCRLDSGTLWEHYEGHFALTNVPGQGQSSSSNNPLASTAGGYNVSYTIQGQDRSTLDHVLELSYAHGYPAYPSSEYQISTAMLTRVNFSFTGW